MYKNQPAVTIKPRYITKERLKVQYPEVEGLTNKSIEQYINSVLLSIVNYLIKQSDYYENPKTEITATYHVRTNAQGILSISIEFYWFSGGAHGMTILESVTFDINTGKIYRLKDLFKESANYVKRLSDIVKRQIREKDIPVIVDFTQIDPNQDYYIENRTLVLYFQLYELTPYAYGFPKFIIPTREIADILKETSPITKYLLQ